MFLLLFSIGIIACGKSGSGGKGASSADVAAVAESTETATDSTETVADSTETVADSMETVTDSTEISDGETLQESSAAEENLKAEETATEAGSGETASALQGAADKETSSQDTAAQGTADGETAGQDTAAQGAAGGETVGQDTAAQGAAGQEIDSQNTADQSATGQGATQDAAGTEGQAISESNEDTSGTAVAVSTKPVVTGGHVVCIDPGHQIKGDNNKEPNGPGSAVMKARVTGGTTGRTTGVPEYQLVLAIGLSLQTELQNRGYTVYMTRTTSDVNISNVERAQFATAVGAEICVRLHADGSENTKASGASALAPSANNPYVSALSTQSVNLSNQILSAYCNATGMKNRGVSLNDTMTGINWCTMPVTILEMGFMTNPADDVNMQDPVYQAAMVQGIANGIDAYFGY